MRQRKWTKEKCSEEALKYNSRSEFQKNSKNAYRAAYDNKWLDEICSHMIRLINPNNFWNKDTCYKEMLKYKTISDFKKNSPVAYFNINHNKWFDFDKYFDRIVKINNFWTKENCLKEALKYNSRSEFQENSTAYYAASRNKWLDEICFHMIKIGNRMKRCIYSYEFEDNSVYIGLTYDINDRNKRHFSDNRSCVFKHSKNTGLIPIFKQLTDYIDVNEASKLEEIKRKEYKNNGWKILNKVKCGGIGGNNIKWNKNKCLEEALKYSNRNEFQKKSGSAYQTSYRNNWLNDICLHMK